jgi:hypothetical protein
VRAVTCADRRRRIAGSTAQRRHELGDRGAHGGGLADVAGVAQAVHQLRPRLRDAAGFPADLTGEVRRPVGCPDRGLVSVRLAERPCRSYELNR